MQCQALVCMCARPQSTGTPLYPSHRIAFASLGRAPSLMSSGGLLPQRANKRSKVSGFVIVRLRVTTIDCFNCPVSCLCARARNCGRRGRVGLIALRRGDAVALSSAGRRGAHVGATFAVHDPDAGPMRFVLSGPGCRTILVSTLFVQLTVIRFHFNQRGQ